MDRYYESLPLWTLRRYTNLVLVHLQYYQVSETNFWPVSSNRMGETSVLVIVSKLLRFRLAGFLKIDSSIITANAHMCRSDPEVLQIA
jgi:hypothetical protein